MLSIVIKVTSCNKVVSKDTIVDLNFPRKIGLHADSDEPRQMCTEASVLWPVKLNVVKTKNTLEQHGGVKYAEVKLECNETKRIFHSRYKGTER